MIFFQLDFTTSAIITALLFILEFIVGCAICVCVCCVVCCCSFLSKGDDDTSRSRTACYICLIVIVGIPILLCMIMIIPLILSVILLLFLDNKIVKMVEKDKQNTPTANYQKQIDETLQSKRMNK